MKAHEDFFLIVLHAYVVAAAEEYLKECPNNYTCTGLAKKVAGKWVKCIIPTSYSEESTDEESTSNNSEESTSDETEQSDSSGILYAI